MVLKHISSGLFRELLTGMIFTNNKSYQLHIDYPVYLLSGKNDAVGQFGKGISKTHHCYIFLQETMYHYKSRIRKVNEKSCF